MHHYFRQGFFSMPSNKNEIKLKNIYPMKSKFDWIAPLMFFLFISCGTFFTFTSDSWIPIAIAASVSLLGIVAFRNRRLDFEARKQINLWFLPTAIGILLSAYPFNSAVPAVVGVIVTILLVAWYGFLRHPPEYRQAHKQFSGGNKLQALTLISLAIEKKPSHWEYYQFRSGIHYFLYKFIEAERDARAALRLKPDIHTSLNALGQALSAQERYLEAKEALSKAVENAPFYSINHLNMGVVNFRLEHFQEAVENIEFALTGKLPFEENLLFATYYLGRSLEQIGKIQKAQEILNSLKKFQDEYIVQVNQFQDLPDYPMVLRTRKELEDMGNYINESND